MPDFDPYHKWLGIPPAEQPAGPHRLLGISADEKNLEVINEAALRQIAFVRQFTIGKHSARAGQLLGELVTALDSVLNQTQIELNGKPDTESNLAVQKFSSDEIEPIEIDDLLPPAFSTAGGEERVIHEVGQNELSPILSATAMSETLEVFRNESPSVPQQRVKPILKTLTNISLVASIVCLFFAGNYFWDTGNSRTTKHAPDELVQDLSLTNDLGAKEEMSGSVKDIAGISNQSLSQHDKSLIAYYPFNGNANDESGHNHHGEIFGAKSTFDRFGKRSRAFNFDGEDDRIVFDCEDRIFGNAAGSTVSIWLNNSMAKGIAHILTKGFHGDYNLGGKQYLQIELANETPHFSLYRGEINTGTWAIGKQNHAPNNLWLHLVCVRDKQSAIYLNGIDVTDYSNSYTKKNNWTIDYNDALDGKPICIGALQSVGMDKFSKFFRGSLDDLRLYNRALSAEEVKSLYRFESVSTATSRSIPNISSVISPAEARLESESPILRKDEQESQLENGFNNKEFQTILKLDPTNEVGLALKNEALNQALEVGNFDEVLDICPDNREALAMKAKAVKIEEFLAKGDYRMVFRLDPMNERAIELALKAKNFTAILDYNPSNPDALALKSSHDEILWEKDLESYRARALVGISSGSIREAYTLYNEIFALLLSETQLIDDQYIGELQVKRLEALLRVLDSLTKLAQERELSSTDLAYVNRANRSDEAQPRRQMIKEVARLKTIGGLPVDIIQILTPSLINASTEGSYPFRE